MVPTQVARKSFDTLAHHTFGRWRTARAVALILLLTALLPLAYASPADPIWIDGFYDAADNDDVVRLLMDATGTSAEPKSARLIEHSVMRGLLSDTDDVPHWTLLAQVNRAPPTRPCTELPRSKASNMPPASLARLLPPQYSVKPWRHKHSVLKVWPA